MTGGQRDYLASTELLVSGAGGWHLVTGLLHWPMSAVKLATVNSMVSSQVTSEM